MRLWARAYNTDLGSFFLNEPGHGPGWGGEMESEVGNGMCNDDSFDRDAP